VVSEISENCHEILTHYDGVRAFDAIYQVAKAKGIEPEF
jgi:hypothetical protein